MIWTCWPIRKERIEKQISTEQSLIRNHGDNLHNLFIMKPKNGELLLSRRSKVDFNSELYGASPECLEWIILQDNYNQHRNTCPGNGKVTMTEALMQNLIFQSRNHFNSSAPDGNKGVPNYACGYNHCYSYYWYTNCSTWWDTLHE